MCRSGRAEAHARARKLLDEKRDMLECLATELMDKEVIEKDEIEALLKQCRSKHPAQPEETT